jgi:hypothetical protein
MTGNKSDDCTADLSLLINITRVFQEMPAAGTKHMLRERLQFFLHIFPFCFPPSQPSTLSWYNFHDNGIIFWSISVWFPSKLEPNSIYKIIYFFVLAFVIVTCIFGSFFMLSCFYLHVDWYVSQYVYFSWITESYHLPIV